MAKSINQFNGLHGLVVPREQLMALQKLAKKENQKHLESWLDDTLKTKKSKKLFIEVLNPVVALPIAKKLNTPGLNATKKTSITSNKFSEMTVTQLKKFTLDFYKTHLKGKKVAIKNHLKEVVFVANAGRKILKPIYSEKVAVIEHLEDLIKDSTYNNFGNRKPTDNKDVIGYLNFKSKITIDGVKRHVRISVVLDRDRNTKLKTFEVGKKEKSGVSHEVAVTNPKDGEKKPLSKSKDNKNNTKESNKLSLLEKMGFTRANFVPQKAADIYTLPNGIGKFLQAQQPHKSLIIIKGNKHSSKSQLAMQIANAYGELGHAVAYIDYEQGGIESKDTVDSINRNTTLKGRKNIAIIGYLESPYEDLQKFCKVVKVIVADSVTDLKITADQLNELRNNYPQTTWIFISQVKENGEMYGGNKMAHNPTVVINCTSDTDFTKRIATLEKNRGNNLEMKYSMFTQNIVKEVKPKKEKTDGKAKK